MQKCYNLPQMGGKNTNRQKFHCPAIILVVIILLQTIIYIGAGIGKAYIHMDEAYSLALTHYDKLDITKNEDFYNNWHTNKYFQEYLAVQEDELDNFNPVYENQKNDVHPPLFYLLLRVAQNFAVGHFSKWPGIILNILIHAGITILFYVIWQLLLAGEKNAKLKALAITGFSAITIASISSAVYIRMYALLTLIVLLTLWLHLKLNSAKTWRPLLLASISTVALLGILTQYYYLFFLAPLYAITSIRLIKEKAWRRLAVYTSVLVTAGVISLLIWPYSLQHMFFGYRGQGVIQSFFNLPLLATNIAKYLQIISYNVFHQLGFVLIAIILGLYFYLQQKHKTKTSHEQILSLIIWPTFIYFLLASAASPYIELRYVMPICGLIFGLVFYALYYVLKHIMKKGTCNKVTFCIMVVVWAAAPIQLALGAMRIELIYRDRTTVMQTTAEHQEAPLLYLVNSKGNRFLDNILPYTIAKQSYLMIDVDYTNPENIKKVLADKDLSHGLILWISDKDDRDKVLESARSATGLSEIEFVQVINMCSVYYLY